MLFFDPYNRLDPHQHIHGKIKEINPAEWNYWREMVENTLQLAGVEIQTNGAQELFTADERQFKLEPEYFKLIVPRGGLKGYESH
jgi:hypothetical protein